MIVWYNPATDETPRRFDDHDGAAIVMALRSRSVVLPITGHGMYRRP